jgi:hypothetical protein
MIHAINNSREVTIKPSHPRIQNVDMIESSRLTIDSKRKNTELQTKDPFGSPIINSPILHSVVTKGKDFMEAIDLGLQQLGVHINEVFIEVLIEENVKTNDLEAMTIVKLTKKLIATPLEGQTVKKTHSKQLFNTYKPNNPANQSNYIAYI